MFPFLILEFFLILDSASPLHCVVFSYKKSGDALERKLGEGFFFFSFWERSLGEGFFFSYFGEEIGGGGSFFSYFERGVWGEGFNHLFSFWGEGRSLGVGSRKISVSKTENTKDFNKGRRKKKPKKKQCATPKKTIHISTSSMRTKRPSLRSLGGRLGFSPFHPWPPMETVSITNSVPLKW